MREYELMAVYDLAVAEAGGSEASVQHLTNVIESRGGKLLKLDHWGRRRMAYPINRSIDGDYIVTRLELEPSGVSALEATLRIDEKVYRHLVVRADELPVPAPPREPRQMPVAAQADMAAPATEAPGAPADEASAAPAAEGAALEEPTAPVADVTGEPESPATVAEATEMAAAEESPEPVAADPGDDTAEGEAPPSGTIAPPEAEAEPGADDTSETTPA
jgi:small subunit ribosomal protein S6